MVATIGLAVNIISALPLRDHDHHHGSSHGHAHVDLNLRAAYVHVIADAATSMLAIGALVGGKFLHWNWLDSAMGIVGHRGRRLGAGTPARYEPRAVGSGNGL